jgi:hypothetical protein
VTDKQLIEERALLAWAEIQAECEETFTPRDMRFFMAGFGKCLVRVLKESVPETRAAAPNKWRRR